MNTNKPWSSEKPTKPGKYQVKGAGSDVWWEVNISRHGGNLEVLVPCFRHRVSLSAGMFDLMQWRKIK